MNKKISFALATSILFFSATTTIAKADLTKQLNSFIEKQQQEQQYNNQPKVSINAINQPLGVVMQNFSALTGYSVTYSNDVDLNSPITVSLTQVSLPLALETILNQADYFYKIDDFKKIITVEAFKMEEFKLPASILDNSDAKYDFSSSGQSGGTNSNNGGGSSGGSSGGSTGNSGSISSTSNFTYKATQTGKDMLNTMVSQVKAVLSKNGSVMVEPTTGIMYVKDYPKYVEQASKLINNWINAFSKQVYIQAYVVDVQLNDSKQWGINWSALNNFRIGGYSGSSNIMLNTNNANGAPTANSPASATPSALTPTTLGALASGAISNMDHTNVFNIALQALATQGNTKVVSSPRIFLINNQVGNIQAGTSYPYISSVQNNYYGASTSGNSQLSYTLSSVSDGVSLTVIPHINADNTIDLTIMPVVTNIVSWENINMGGQAIQEPVVATRSEYTRLTAKNGQLIILGGATTNTGSVTHQKIPILGDIPIVGWLFKSINKNKQNETMVILLRATVINPNEKNSIVTQGKDIDFVKSETKAND